MHVNKLKVQTKDCKNTTEKMNEIKAESLFILQFINRDKVVVIELVELLRVLSHKPVITKYPTSILLHGF